MIKFFRKIHQQLLPENKFSKYLLYAIGKRTTFHYALYLDITIDETKAFFLKRTQYRAIVLLKFWKTETLHDSIVNYLQLPGFNRIYSHILGTVRSPINSGNIDLLSSYELNNEIFFLFEKVDPKLIDIKRHDENYFRNAKELNVEVVPKTYHSKEYYTKYFEAPSDAWKERVTNGMNNIPMDLDKVPFQSDFNMLIQNEFFYLAYTKVYI